MTSTGSISHDAVDEKRFSVLLSILVLAGAVPITLVEASFGLLAVVLVAAMAGPFWIDRRETVLVPAWMIRVAVVLAAVWAFCEYAWFGWYPEIVLGRFMIWVCVCKFFERKTDRDYGQLLVVAFLLLVVCSRVSTTVLFPLTLALYLTLGIYVAILFHLKCEMSRYRVSVLRFEPSARSRVMQRGLLRPMAWVAGGAVLVAILTFLFLPRIGAGAWGRTDRRGTARATGFGDKIEFGQLGTRIQSSDELVMRVKLYRGGVAYGGATVQPYLRGQTLEVYERPPNRRTWQWRHPTIITSTPRRWEPDGKTIRLVDEASGDDPFDGLTVEVTLARAVPRQPLFAVYPPVRIETMGFKPVEREWRTQLLYGMPRPDRTPRYVVHSPVRVDAALAAKLPRPNERFRPLVSRRVREYAEALLDRKNVRRDETAAVAQAICDHLRFGEFSYTLDQSGVDSAVEPVEDFLFNRRRGHCEYFASAMTVMCQLMGLSARVVTGYRGGDYNVVGGFYEVRENHAHSWVEVYVSGRGWVLYDPTAQTPDDAAQASHWWGPLAAYVGYWQFQWASSVISYDDDQRSEVLDRVEEWLTGTPLSVAVGEVWGEGWGRLVAAWDWATANAVRTIIAITGLVVALCGVVWMGPRLVASIRAWGRVRPRRRAAARRRPEVAFFDEFVAVAGRLGCERAAHQTPREFATEVDRHLDGTVSTRCVAEAVYAVEFGGRTLDDRHRREITETLAHLRRVARR